MPARATESEHSRAQLWSVYFALRGIEHVPPCLAGVMGRLQGHLDDASPQPGGNGSPRRHLMAVVEAGEITPADETTLGEALVAVRRAASCASLPVYAQAALASTGELLGRFAPGPALQAAPPLFALDGGEC